MKLSVSAVQKYGQCAKMYKFHYVDRIREKTATAFLAFGSAMDAALNSILLNLKDGKVNVNYKEVFDENWKTIKINNVVYDLPFCTLVGYSSKDFVYDLLTDDDKLSIAKVYTGEDGSCLDVWNEVSSAYEQRIFRKFTKEQHELYNYFNYLSLRRKAHLMLDAYVRDIVPKIKRVISVQKKVTLGENEEFVGWVDAVVELYELEGLEVVLDNKTSSVAYDEDKAKNNQQLSTYGYMLDIKYVAFAVMSKAIKLNKKKTCKVCSFQSEGSHKTCNNELNVIVKGKEKKQRCNGEWNEEVSPEATTQLLVEKINTFYQEAVIDNFGEVADAIKAGHFPRNFNACDNMYGQKCPYYNLCMNGNMNNLVVVEENK